ncbi:SIS domain-containing protein [bacterium]|nr:SIS domain-containing protein [bacterium]
MMHQLESIFRRADGAAQYAGSYFARMREVMDAVDPQKVAAAVEMIEQTIDAGRTIFILANGGSAAVASHFVNDAVCGAWVDGAKPIRAFALADNVESITALANDYGYDGVFTGQLRMLMHEGDLVLALSVSGNSGNVVSAVEWAAAHGARTMAWTGFDGGRLRELAQCCVHMPTTADEYGPVEDMFSILEHVVMTFLALKRGRRLHKG